MARNPLSLAEDMALQARSMGEAATVQVEWLIKVTKDDKKYLASTASEEVQKFMSDLLRQTGADSMADELFTRGTHAGLNIPSIKAAEARGDKTWEPGFKHGEPPDLFRDSEDMRTIAKVWRDACDGTASAHSRVMDTLGSKQQDLLKGKQHLRKKFAHAKSDTTLQNTLDLGRHLGAAYAQQAMGAGIHREYLNTLTSCAGDMERRFDQLLSYAISTAVQDWPPEHAMYRMKMEGGSKTNLPEAELNEARTRYFPTMAKHVLAMEEACETMASFRDLCASGKRLEQVRGSEGSALDKWTDRLAYYTGELDLLTKYRKKAENDLDVLSATLGLKRSEVKSLQLKDLEGLGETKDIEAFQRQVSAIAKSKLPKVRAPRTPRPIAFLPVFSSDEVVVKEPPRPDLRATARAGNEAVQRYLSDIGVDWKGSSTGKGKGKVAGESDTSKGVTLDQIHDLDETWQLVRPRARQGGQSSGSGSDSADAIIGAEPAETTKGDAEGSRAWDSYWPEGTIGYYRKMGRIKGKRDHYETFERPLTRTESENELVIDRLQTLQGKYESPRMRELRYLRDAITRLRSERLSKLLPAGSETDDPLLRVVPTRTDFKEVLQAEAEAAEAAGPPSREPQPLPETKSIAKRTWEKWQAIRQAQFPELTITLHGLLPPEEVVALDAIEFSQTYDRQLAEGTRNYGYSFTYEDHRFETIIDWARGLEPDVRPRAKSFGGYPSARLSVWDRKAAAAAIDSAYHDQQAGYDAD